MIRKAIGAAASLAAMALAPAAFARPVTDCPGRDARFSMDMPLIDILLSPAAKAVMAQRVPNIAKLPPNFMGTTPPSFAAILTPKEATRFTGMTEDQIAPLDAELRKVPVTAADRIARCQRYDNDVPAISMPKGKARLLVFEKINGFKDVPSFNAAHAAFEAMAQRKGWAIAFTDKAGVFNPRSLRQFDVVIWNNISGDVLTLSQRAAFRRWIEAGGAYAGVHGSAGDFIYPWAWYADGLIGARFIGHPMNPQFQEARVAVNRDHPLAATLPADWRMTDEWYSFRTNPRAVGAKVLLSLDETTYSPVGIGGQNLRMGEHPIAWTNCIGRGRMFYSAIGHRPETYSQPQALAAMEAGIAWAATAKGACRGK